MAASGRVANICFEVLCPHPNTMSSYSASPGHLQLWRNKILCSLPWQPTGEKPKAEAVVELSWHIFIRLTLKVAAFFTHLYSFNFVITL